MSYPSSSQSQSPYKSRLFNFLNRQYLNINDHLGKNARRLGLVIKWTVQTMLYPVYVMVQTARIMGRKLKSTFTGNQWELNEVTNQPIPSLPDSDQQINLVLKEITQGNIISSLPNINLQGIATNTENSHLVLVNSHNLTFDVLSLQQQRKLQLLMRDLRADYWDKKRLVTIKEKQLSKVFPRINPTCPNNTLSLALFWQLMAWVQKSYVAISLNIFKESQYLSSKEIKSSFDLEQIAKKPKLKRNFSLSFLTNIDNKLANLEGLYLVPNNDLLDSNSNKSNKLNIKLENYDSVKENHKQNFSIQALIQSAIDYFFGDSKGRKKFNIDKSKTFPNSSNNYQKEDLSKALNYNPHKIQLSSANYQQLINNLSNNIKSNFVKIRPKLNQIQNSLNAKINNISTVDNHFKKQKDPYQIQILIWAAIDYFFNKKNNSLSPTKSKQLQNNSNSNKLGTLAELGVEENWLSWDDLYGNNLEQKLSNSLTESDYSTSQKLVSTKEIKSELKSISDNKVALNSGHDIKTNNQNSPRVLQQQLSTTNNLSKSKNSNVNSVQNPSHHNQKQLEENSKWLETKAVNLGYEKHFLQTILEWIDQAILWIEELFIKILRWFQRK